MKNNLIKGLIVLILGIVLIGTNTVFAADSVEDLLREDSIQDFSDDNTSTPETTTTPTTNTNTSTTTTETKKDEITTGNSSVYNNTTTPTTTTSSTTTTQNKDDKTLAKTGIEDTLPMIVLVVVCGISAVFAFKKIKEYKNV